ncbi:MAG: hypothetical protein NE327_17835 [Lentisphaeraceae bacterium]|nr:hypothetical protein [Lentisphaeraceae bacterium]
MFHHNRVTNININNKNTLSSANARADASDAKLKTEHLESEVERLLMITEALWGILKEQLQYTDDELIRRVQEIDMRDGQLDGKVGKSAPKKCTSCGRTVMKKRPQCMYCGHIVKRDVFER